jgi:hypothetical protein
MLRCGMGAEISGFLLRLVVKARPREATVADILSVEDMFVLYGCLKVVVLMLYESKL